jgi:hypothetical protein
MLESVLERNLAMAALIKITRTGFYGVAIAGTKLTTLVDNQAKAPAALKRPGL